MVYVLQSIIWFFIGYWINGGVFLYRPTFFVLNRYVSTLMRNVVIIVLILYGCGFRSYSQEKEMNTDRPDQTEETHLVNKHQLQVETGFLYNKYDTGRSSFISRTMIRYGISKKWEVGLLVEQGRGRNRYITK